MALLGSCISYDRCVSRFGRTPGDTVYVPYFKQVPPDSIATVLLIDSIPYMVPGDTVYVEDPKSRARIRYWRDKYENAINIRADCDSIIIRDTIPVPFPVILDPPPPSPLKKAWITYQQTAALALPLLLLTLFLVKTAITKRS